MKPAPYSSTKGRALGEAKSLLQRFGFNGFSFQHVADRLGIKKPSLYQHFASKESLGLHLIEDYHRQFQGWTETIHLFGPREKIGALFELYFNFSADEGACCPLSALVADYHSLPKTMQKALNKLFAGQRSWIEKTVEEGKRARIFRRDVSTHDLAEMVLSAGIGAQFTARIGEDAKSIRTTKLQILNYIAERS